MQIVKLQVKNKKINAINLYCPPICPIEKFIDVIRWLCNEIQNFNVPILLMNDFKMPNCHYDYNGIIKPNLNILTIKS